MADTRKFQITLDASVFADMQRLANLQDRPLNRQFLRAIREHLDANALELRGEAAPKPVVVDRKPAPIPVEPSPVVEPPVPTYSRVGASVSADVDAEFPPGTFEDDAA